MSSKNTKTKTATTTETKKQTAGSEKVTAVPNANTIVEKKMEDKVVAVEKKTEVKTETKKAGTKVEVAPTPVTATATPAKTETKKADTKKGGAKVEATPATPATTATTTPAKAETKKADVKKGGAKAEAVPVVAPAKAEAKKGGDKKVAKVEAKTEKKVEAVQDDEEEGEVTGTKLRYFKLIYNEEVQGRYCGKKPKQAANKAFSSIIKDLKKSGQQNGGVNVDLNFSIRECTRNSKHKEYRYIGKRQVLETPVQVQIANVDGSVKQIEYKFHNKLQKAPKA